MLAKFGGESARISCACVPCVSQWKMRAQCRITAITWVVNLIQSIHAKCFVNTPCASVRFCIFLFWFRLFRLLPLERTQIFAVRIRIHLFPFRCRSAIYFYSKQSRPQSKYETTTKRNTSLDVHQRVKPTLCSQKSRLFLFVLGNFFVIVAIYVVFFFCELCIHT